MESCGSCGIMWNHLKSVREGSGIMRDHSEYFGIIVVTGRPFRMCGSPVDLSKCMGHRSSFPIIRVTGRPLEMYGSLVDLSECTCHWSTFPNVWVTGRPFQLYGSPVVLSECMGHRSSFPNVWVPKPQKSQRRNVQIPVVTRAPGQLLWHNSHIVNNKNSTAMRYL